MGNELQVLEEHRNALLLAEILALLHDVGKLSSCFLDQMAKNPTPHSAGFEHENAIQSVANFVDGQFLTTLQNRRLRNQLRWHTIRNREQIGQVLDLIVHHDSSRHSAFLVRLLNRCDGIDSGADKGTTRHAGLPAKAKQDANYTLVATAFGYEPYPPIKIGNLDHSRQSMTGVVGQYLRNGGTRVANIYSEVVNAIRMPYSTALGETRRSANDVTLWDHSFSVATLYKSALATFRLRGALGIDHLRWRILRVSFDVLGLYAKAVKIADLLAYRQAVADACAAVKQLVEVEYPLGNEVYRDTSGIYFTYPDLDLFPELTQKIRQRVEAADLELAPRIAVEQSPANTAVEQLKRLLTDAHRQARRDLAQPFAPENVSVCWAAQWENLPPGQWEICPVCRLRPMEEGQETCEHCRRRRASRIAAWLGDPQTTIWMDEIADRHDRVALIVGRFGLDDWLSGDLVQTMLVKAVENRPGDCVPKNPSPARLRRVWETCRCFWTETVQDILERYDCGNEQRCTRLIVIPDEKTGWRENVPYDGTVGGQAISLLWCESGKHFITISNLKLADGAVREGQEFVVEEPDDPRQTRRFTAQGVMPALGVMGHYRPILTLLESPDQFLALVPAAQAPEIAAEIKKAYEQQMGKVQNRLPLFLGLVFFQRKMPLTAVMDTGRRMLNGESANSEWGMGNGEWGIAKVQQNGQNVTLDLERSGQRITYRVPAVMGDGTADDWYPYFELVGTPAAHHEYRFERDGTWWVHVRDLQAGETVRVTPSRFAYLFLEHTAQRFRFDPAQDVQYLDELPRLAEMWQTLCRTPEMTDTRLQNIWTLFRSKWVLWRLDEDETADFDTRRETFKELVETTFVRTNVTGVDEEEVLNGTFDRCLELYHHILKARVKEAQDD